MNGSSTARVDRARTGGSTGTRGAPLGRGVRAHTPGPSQPVSFLGSAASSSSSSFSPHFARVSVLQFPSLFSPSFSSVSSTRFFFGSGEETDTRPAIQVNTADTSSEVTEAIELPLFLV